MNKFEIEILSPEGIIYSGEILSASFPGSSGVITVLPGHVNLVTKLNHGEVSVEGKNGIRKITITGGFVEISDNRVNVVAEFAIPSEQANRHKIEQAVKLAKDMKSKRKESSDISVVESQLKKAVLGLKSNIGLKRKK